MQGWEDVFIVIAGILLGVAMYTLGFRIGSRRQKPRRGGGTDGKPKYPRRPKLWLVAALGLATANFSTAATDIETGITYPTFSIYMQARSYFALMEYKENALWVVPEVYLSTGKTIWLMVEVLLDTERFSAFTRVKLQPITGEWVGKTGIRFSLPW